MAYLSVTNLKYTYLDYNKQIQRQQLAKINILTTNLHAKPSPISINKNLQKNKKTKP
jgi:hypothetical protein